MFLEHDNVSINMLRLARHFLILFFLNYVQFSISFLRLIEELEQLNSVDEAYIGSLFNQ